LINEVEISDPNWAEQHWKTIAMSYRRAPCFAEMEGKVRALYEHAGGMTHLSAINQSFIAGLCPLLGIHTPLYRSEDLGQAEGRNERLIHLCQAVQGSDYLSGPAASCYLDEAAFAAAGLGLSYMSYADYPEYPQLFGEFQHAVSVIDLLFNTGADAMAFLQRQAA